MLPRLTFDTNMAGIRETRVFWASLCELAHCPFVVTETGAVESLRRERLETERLWKKQLARAGRELNIRWSATERRRLSTNAAGVARDWLPGQLRGTDGPYRRDARRNAAIDALLIERTSGDAAAFDIALERVRKHGNSAAARAEWDRDRHELNAVAQAAGIAPADLARSLSP